MPEPSALGWQFDLGVRRFNTLVFFFHQENEIYNADKARGMVARLPGILGTGRTPCPQGCDRALDHAILTAPDARDPALVARLDAVAGRVL